MFVCKKNELLPYLRKSVYHILLPSSLCVKPTFGCSILVKLFAANLLIAHISTHI